MNLKVDQKIILEKDLIKKEKLKKDFWVGSFTHFTYQLYIY